MNTAKQQKTNISNADSLFGMALTQCFVGAVLGPAADMAWEACEITSAIHEDRNAKPTAKASPQFDMGKPKSLGGFFDMNAANINETQAPMRPIMFEGYNHKAPKPTAFGFGMAA